MSDPTPRTIDTIVEYIVNELDGVTVTGNDGYSLVLNRSKDPTDVTSQGSVWSDGAFAILVNVSQDGTSVPGSGVRQSVRWKARFQFEVQVIQRIPSDPTVRWSNIYRIPTEIQNRIDAALETTTRVNFAMRDRLILMATKESGKDFYRLRFRFNVEEYWDHT